MDYQMVRIFQFLQAKSDIYKKKKQKKPKQKTRSIKNALKVNDNHIDKRQQRKYISML